MERRHFISVAGGLGLGLLIPGVVYRYLMRGTNVGNANIRAYLNDGPQAADVPVLIRYGSLGRDVDGLLGMSFLSRFDLSIGRRDWKLSQKK